MLVHLTLAGLFGLQVAAYPHVLNDLAERELSGKALSKARTNCGPTPCGVFDAGEQFVSTSGKHAFKAPQKGDLRGPCPGLNSAANHGYIPHNGIAHIADAISGLGQAFGMSVDLAGFLAAYSILTSGDPLTLRWSIGGPLPGPSLPVLLGPGQGLSYTHNQYEGDASLSRADAYINNGDAFSLSVPRFANTYGATSAKDRYSLHSFVRNYNGKVQQSIHENPYYFSAPVSGFVAPVAFQFVINFMSNHSAEEPNGYLDGDIFKTFFSVSGDDPKDFTYKFGHERIPDNWYRRPSANQYSIPAAVVDFVIGIAAYPGTFRVGGNTGKTDSYVGADVSLLTGGAQNLDDLTDLSGEGFRCFLGQFIQAATFDVVSSGLLNAVTSLVDKYVAPVSAGLGCPPIEKFDNSQFNKYPGYNYRPTASE